MQQRKRVVLDGWLTTVKLATARLGFTPSMEPLIWSWLLPETSKQRRSCCTTMVIGVNPPSWLTHGSNTETSDHKCLYARWIGAPCCPVCKRCYRRTVPPHTFLSSIKKKIVLKRRLKLRIMKHVFLQQLFLTIFYIFLFKHEEYFSWISSFPFCTEYNSDHSIMQL